jgi:CBS domain-containing protein
MLMPPVSRYMTMQPWTTTRDAKLVDARHTMKEHGVRHLAVVDKDKHLVGMVSERDIHLAGKLTRNGSATVEDAMTTDVLAVRANDAVADVAEAMAKHKYGSAVVVDAHGVVEGIFTTVDGMQVLADILRREAD